MHKRRVKVSEPVPVRIVGSHTAGVEVVLMVVACKRAGADEAWLSSMEAYFLFGSFEAFEDIAVPVCYVFPVEISHYLLVPLRLGVREGGGALQGGQ